MSWIAAVNDRSSHLSATPIGGGVSIVFSLLLGLILQMSTFQVIPYYILLLIIGIFLLAVIGFLDDLLEVSIIYRLIVQFGIVSIFLVLSFSTLTITSAVGKMALFAATLFVLVWWINLYNFMDGIDGIAAIQSISILVCYLVLISLRVQEGDVIAREILTYSIVVCLASVTGFIVFNWSPAKIFMGDVGSLPIPYFIGVIAIIGLFSKLAPIWSWIIPTGVFTVDASYTLGRRILQREIWWKPHRTHAYQNLAVWLQAKHNKGDEVRTRAAAHRLVSLLILVFNIFWLTPLALFSQAYPSFGILILVVAWFPILLYAVYWSRTLYEKHS